MQRVFVLCLVWGMAALPVAAAEESATEPARAAESAGASAKATPQRRGKLNEIYRLAVTYDAQFAAAEAIWRAARQKVPLARAPLLPQVQYQYQVTESRQHLTGTRFGAPVAEVTTGTVQRDALSLSMTLYDHTLYVALRRATSEVARARAARDAAHQAMILRAVGRYFDVLQGHDEKRLATAERAAIKRRFEQAQARYEVGLASSVEMQETHAAYDQATVREIDARNLLLDRIEALSVVTGSREFRLGALGEDLPLLAPQPDDIEQWVAKALGQNLDHLMRIHDLEVAKRNHQQERAARLPKLTGSYGSDTTDNSAGVFGANRLQEERLGVALTVPLFQGGALFARATQRAHELEAARAQLAHSRRVTEQQTRSAYHNVHAGIARVRAHTQSLASARVELEANQVGLETGTRDTADVVEATSRLYSAERDLARARYGYVLDVLRLAQVAGSLSATDLQWVDRWLY